MPLFGPPDVEKLKANGNVKGLLKALGYKKDVVIRQTAAQALVEMDHGRSALDVLLKVKDAQVVEPLIAVLEDKDWFVRQGAAKALGQIGDARAVEPLIIALEDENSSTRENAARALGQIGDVRAVEPLITLLENEGPISTYNCTRKAAIEALGQIGTPAVESLIAAFKDKKGSIRETVAEILVKIGDRRAIQPLVAALKDAGARESAAKALGGLGWQPDKSETGALYWLGKNEWDKCVEIGAPAVEPLITVLQDDENWRIHGSAARALGQIGDIRAVDPLIIALGGRSRRTCEAAARALGQIGDIRAVDSLIAALARSWPGARVSVLTETENVNSAAAKALVQIGDVRAVEPLITALEDENSDTREAAARALGQIGDIRAVDPLIIALGDDFFRVQNAAAEALEKIGTPAVEPLVAALKDAGARESAAKALGSLGWQPDRNETGALYWLGRHKWDKCVEIGAPAVEPLITALRDKHTSVRQNAVKALGEIGDERAVLPLTAALKDEEYMRVAVLEALMVGKFPAARIVTPLVRFIKARSPYTARRHADTRNEKGRYISDKEEAVLAGKALTIALEHAPSDITTDELRKVADLDNVVQITQFITECGYNAGAEEDVAFDSSHLKQLARQELIRRGLQA